MTKGKDAEIEIDPLHPAISDANQRNGKLYQKNAQVQARQATRKTAVRTVLADGTTETKNIAEPGDIIVTGAGGERWVVKPETFQARYVLKPGSKGTYIACGHIVAVKNPFGRPISIMAPWGEMQHGSKDCMIADVFNPATQQRAGEPYLIAAGEFALTYQPVKTAKNQTVKPRSRLPNIMRKRRGKNDSSD